MAGYKTEDIISAMPGLLDAAAASGEDLSSTSDIISDAITAFGMKASDTTHLADVMAQASANANTSIGLLGESFKYVGATAGAMGYSVEDATLALGLMANAGVKGSMGGTALKNAIVNMASPTDTMASVMEKYNLSLTDADGNMKSLKSVMDMLRSNMSGLDKATQSAAASQLFGKEAMSGMLSIINASETDYNNLSKAIYNADGAAKEMANTKLDSLSGQWTILKSAIEGAQIELGDRLAPYAKEFVTWLTGKIPSITDKIVSIVDYISKHTDTIKSMALTIAGLGASFAVFKSVGSIGNTINGFSKLMSLLKGGGIVKQTTKIATGIKGIGLAGKLLPALISPAGLAVVGTMGAIGVAVKANHSLMKKTTSTTVEELGPIEQIMNVLHGNLVKTKSEMQKLGLVYEDFGSNIGSNFRNKIEESTKSLMDFQFFINKINLDGVIDEKESITFDNKVKEMCDNAVKSIENKKNETQTALSNLFSEDGTVSNSEQATLDYFSQKYDAQITSEQKLQDEIYKIKEKAIEDHGKLLDKDIQQIKEKQQEMARIELEATGGNKDEINYAKNKFKARAEGLDIKDASSLLKESAKERDDAIVEIKAKYDTYIDNLKSELSNPELDAAKRGNLESALSELEQSKANKIKAQNDLYNSNLNTVYNQNPNLKGQLNKYTGEELTNKDISSQKALDKIKETYDGIEQITKSGNYRLYDDSKKAWRNVQVAVDEGSGEIVGLYDSASKRCGGYTKEMANEVRKLGKSHTDLNTSASEAMNALGSATINAKGQIISANNEVIASLDKKRISADGVRTGILNLNGTPIEIKSNASGEITNMNEVKNAINNIPNDKKITVNANTESAQNKVNSLLGSLWEIVNNAWSTTVNVTKKIVTNVERVVSNSAQSRERKQTEFANKQRNIGRRASGTNSSSSGLSTVDERGWELSDRKTVPIIGSYNGNPLTYMSKGTKILNHMQSVNDMKREVAQQIDVRLGYSQSQIQYQVAQAPQPKVVGVGGINFGDINVNVENSEDIEGIIALATQEVARKLKEAFSNIKK